MSGPEIQLLVVEDDDDDAVLIETCISPDVVGFPTAVERVATVSGALGKAAGNRYDLMLVDYRLGAEDGLSFLREARSRGTACPAILLTGQGDERLAVEALRSGAADYIPKTGMSRDSLSSAIRRCVELHRAEEARKDAEQALRRNEILSRSLLDLLPQRVFVKDRESTYLFVNAAYARDLGREPGAVVGTDDFAHFPRALAESYRSDDRAVMASGRPRDIAERYSKYGEERWIHTVKVPYRDEDGAILGVVGLFSDITERKRAEDALRESEHLLSESQRVGKVGSWRIDTTGRLTVSEEYRRIAGLEEAAFPMDVGDTIGRIVHPEDRAASEAWVAAILAGRDPGEFECRIVRPGGAIVALLVRGALSRGSTGAPEFVLGTVQDVTERKAREESLRLQAAALNAAANAIVLTGVDGRIEWTNSAFTTFTGYGQEEARGRNPSILKSGRQDGAFYENLWGTILGGSVWQGRLVNRRKDGSLYDEEMTITPLKGAGGAIEHFIAVKQDVSRRVMLEAQLRQAQKMEAVGQLAGGVAHDFNNLLTAILGYGELMMGKIREGDPLRGYLSEILKAGHRSASLTRQLLAFSRRQALQPAVVDLNSILRDTEKMLVRLIGEDIDLRMVLDPELGAVFVDPGQFEQVVMNLVVNSRDAMPGGGSLTIETSNVDLAEDYARDHPGSAAGSYALVAVTDTGTGIDPGMMARIFEPFFTTKEQGKGTGLGLATVYGIVKQSGGYISVYSEVGHGTTFRVYLPRASSPAGKAAGQVPAEVPLGSGQRLLVVEDEESIRNLLGGVLEHLGYRVTLAANGGEALLLVEEQGLVPDLVLTDVVMPAMSGAVLVDRLRRSRPGLRAVFMSGYTDAAIRHQGGLPPGTPFLPKPFTNRDLAMRVQAALQGGDGPLPGREPPESIP